MTQYTTRPLDAGTWDAFARLCEKHNGVWAATGAHGSIRTTRSTAALAPALRADGLDKEHLVRDGRTHAAVVFDGEVAVGWCQFGTPGELPSIKHKKEY